MKMVSLTEKESKGSSLKIKGRLMPQKEFSTRLQSMCNTLGFENVKMEKTSNLEILDCFSDILKDVSRRDAVIVLSCRVQYNPNWGGLCGHPQLLTRMKTAKNELCPAGFLAPFLQQYSFAQEHIYLTETQQGNQLITLPTSFLNNDEERQGSKLIIALDKVAEPDDNGAIIPVSTSGSRLSYSLSSNLRQTLDAQNFDWKPGRSIPIGRYLNSQLFSFTSAEQANDQNHSFSSTLFPYLRQIVTHRTPHLRAAEIHLRQQFSRVIALLTNERQTTFPNLLCLAGLDIDMTPFAGHDEKFFVPWKAYMERVDGNGSEKFSLDQDDLFVRLMQ